MHLVILGPEVCMARKIRDENDARDCIEAWSQSGRPLAEWARAHGIDGRSLHCWKLNLLGRDQPGRLVELVPEPARSARYLVRFDGIEVEVGDDFRDGTLERLLRVLTAC